MLNYIAWVWNAADTPKSEAARQQVRLLHSRSPDWRTAIAEEGLHVCYCDVGGPSINSAHKLPGSRGAIVGTLFRRPSVGQREDEHDPAPVTFDERAAAALVSSEGCELVERYWGRYVAFLRRPDTHDVWVLRDPTGGVPCQHATVRGVRVYFVRLEDLDCLSPGWLSINRHYLLGYLAYDSVCVRETALQEVSTLLAGERMEHRGDSARVSFCWSPPEVAARDTIEDEFEAVRLTRRVVRNCVHAWGSRFSSILLELSGGLDSSIVLSCLMANRGGRKIRCRTHYTTGMDFDERSYARLAAKHFGCELHESESPANYTLDSLAKFPRALSPFPCIDDEAAVQRESARIRSQGVEARFTGDGGDELFFRTALMPSAVDYVWRHGISAAALPVALDDARVSRTSFWRVLRVVAQKAFRGQSTLFELAVGDNRALLHPQAKAAARADATLWHPLYREPSRLPPNKLLHCYLVTLGATRGDTPGMPSDAPTEIAPLLSQPIMELCLRIPAYLARHNGRDRAVARSAFAADLPREIVLRNAKGHGSFMMQDLVRHNLDLVREFLLDGFLAAEHFIDRPKLERVLSSDVTTIQSNIIEILTYLSVEAWSRQWYQPHQQVAA